MADDTVSSLLVTPSEGTLDRLFNDAQTVFWVDFRAEETEVIEACERVLATGDLSFQLDGESLSINRNGTSNVVPLTFSLADRHIVILCLNKLLAPDYEIRFCIASNGMDTLAFVPLSVNRWLELEAEHKHLNEHFAVIHNYPNLFVDGYGVSDWRQLANEPEQKLNAVRAYREQFGCSLKEAKREVDRYVFLNSPDDLPKKRPNDSDDPLEQGTLF